MPKKADKPANRAEKNQGMNWIRKERRLAIYMRDGLACAWCGQGLEDGIQLTLDHLTPYSEHGTNDNSNLITCCKTCNSMRGARSVEDFAHAVAEYTNRSAHDLLVYIEGQTGSHVNVGEAKDMMARRGGYKQVIDGIAGGSFTI